MIFRNFFKVDLIRLKEKDWEEAKMRLRSLNFSSEDLMYRTFDFIEEVEKIREKRRRKVLNYNICNK